MNHFFSLNKDCEKLNLFPHITEFMIKKNNVISFNSFNICHTNTIRIYYIIDGKFDWYINNENYSLYPGDTTIILPGQEAGSKNGSLEIGTLCGLSILPEVFDTNSYLRLGKWSSLSKTEQNVLKNIFLFKHNPVLSKLKDAEQFFQKLEQEIFKQEVAYATRVNQILDELLVTIARKLMHQDNAQRDFPQTFVKLEQALRKDLSHPWTVEEMAGLVGLGTTAFTEKAKSYTGFSPLNYLITMRISEATKLLKGQQKLSVTDIALDTGFYSSQHFATTFKKLTGYTPSQFKKINSKHI
jgi:AraC-like DNA-binding protein